MMFQVVCDMKADCVLAIEAALGGRLASEQIYGECHDNAFGSGGISLAQLAMCLQAGRTGFALEKVSD